ncbi:carboxypeptidase-like regulatory domain-containing protein [Ferruginibacter albus]|uniref:carboxypeptidase-like regulatory domain-containing protein n=1 Tax=Ferruginibacter albus TaxID=2875540 RepID=UPI001CC52941|nr:carboxypeptidase-like regulatory domain-containing protein [Ferruginibacter albus]UAY52075.1 carboxypeptidase-like regulatory domain-containing protein [Ferruginibacter albus]
MNNEQRSKLDSYNRITSFNTTHSADTSTISEYAAEATAFNNALAAINAAAGKQEEVNDSTVVPVADLKAKMSAVIMRFIQRGMVRARQNGNAELANELNEPASFILFATKTVAVQRAQNLRNLLNNNLGTLSNIAASDISIIDDAIDAYDAIKDVPRSNAQHKKANGTDLIPTGFATADVAIENMYSLLHSYFIESKPELVDEFTLAKEIINTGIRHTSIDIRIAAATDNTPVANAVVTNTKTGRQYITDAAGTIHINRHPKGYFTFKTSAAGKQDTTLTDIHIISGTNNSFTVMLQDA